MLQMESGSKLCEENLENLANENEQTRSLNPESTNIIDSVGANCNKELRGKMIAEINESSSNSDMIREVNKTVDLRKRDAVCADQTVSKRRKLSEEETAVVTSNVNEESQPRRSEIQNERAAERIIASSTVEAQNLEENNCVVQIKVECTTESDEINVTNIPSGSGSSNPIDIKPAVKVEKADASSTSRVSCRFGIRCYRRNPMHRLEEAHPGDHDYRRPFYPPPPKGTPDCPYGDQCYRRNPIHFEQFNHPPETDFEQNYKNYRLRQRRRQQQRDDNIINNSELDDDNDSEDPFNDDEAFDPDYEPNCDEEDEEDYDACDRAEE